MLGRNKIGRTLVGVGFVAMALLKTGIVFRFLVGLYFYVMHKFVNDGEGKRLDTFVVFDIDANQSFINKVAAVFFAVWVIGYLNIGLILLIANMMNTPIYNTCTNFGWLILDLKVLLLIGTVIAGSELSCRRLLRKIKTNPPNKILRMTRMMI
jgi:hypothetical protein